MKYQLFSLATWVSADPRRVYLMLVVIAVMLALLATANITVAGWAAGGGDAITK